MKRWIAILSSAAAIALAGCASSAPPLPPGMPQPDPTTGKVDYWLAQPGAASVFCPDYDRLWDTCQSTARDDQFAFDQDDYRQGLLTTRPLPSRQFFEIWRNDCGDSYGVAQSSLQTIRRTIDFEFQSLPGGFVVTPKVVVERLAQLTLRITSPAEYSRAFTGVEPLSNDPAQEAARVVLQDSTEHWYAIGRDSALEAELAQEIQRRIGQ